MTTGLEPTITLEHPVALASVAASAVEASAAYTMFCDSSNSNKLSAMKRDGSVVSFEGFVANVQDIGKRQLRWSADNGADHAVEMVRVQPSEVAAPPFIIGTGAFTNPSGTRLNQVISLGWNMGSGGVGPIVAGEPAFGLGIESFFNPDGTANDYMEHHWYAVTAAGVQRRPQSWTFNRTTGELQGTINAERLTFAKEAGGLQTMVIQHDVDPVTVTFGRWQQLKVHLLNEYNDTPFLSQNHISGYKEICRVDANGHVVIGNGGVPTKLGGNFACNGATPAAKPTIVGSRGNNAALADLLTKLAATGILQDGTTA